MPKAPLLKTTSLSTKGQVVIPEAIRKGMKLEAGAQFVVYGQGDTLMLKMIAAPDRRELKALFERAAGRRPLKMGAPRKGAKP
jgi:AbrB family looped-hinge helix DNA binding protein